MRRGSLNETAVSRRDGHLTMRRLSQNETRVSFRDAGLIPSSAPGTRGFPLGARLGARRLVGPRAEAAAGFLEAQPGVAGRVQLRLWVVLGGPTRLRASGARLRASDEGSGLRGAHPGALSPGPGLAFRARRPHFGHKNAIFRASCLPTSGNVAMLASLESENPTSRFGILVFIVFFPLLIDILRLPN